MSTKVPPPIFWRDEKLVLLDQRKLPLSENFLEFNTLEECHGAIKDMVVRGAPCIGFTAIFGLALFAKNHPNSNWNDFQEAAKFLKSARPTAVNLEFEIDRCLSLASELYKNDNKNELQAELVSFGQTEMELAFNRNLEMAKIAHEKLKELFGDIKFRLQTHCNTGFLACGTLGTPLGVISHLNSIGKLEHVWVDETRPYMQGTRLTAYELGKEQISHQIVVEGAASYLMREKLVDAIFVGADRIVANGDTANKVGTSGLAIVAKYYKVPFFVVAPTSSFDLTIKSGNDIPIELRNQDEILKFNNTQLAPHGSQSLNPSFDVTSSDLITGIICENGLISPDYLKNVEKIVGRK